jgi:hypothetical protein
MSTEHTMKYVSMCEGVLRHVPLTDEERQQVEVVHARLVAAAQEQAHSYSAWRAMMQTLRESHIDNAVIASMLESTLWDQT